MIKLSCVILFSMTVNCKKHNFGVSAQDGLMSVFSTSFCVWLACPRLSGFAFTSTSRTIIEFLDDTKVHVVWKFSKCGLLWCSLKCSKGVGRVVLSTNPYNLGHVNQKNYLRWKRTGNHPERSHRSCVFQWDFWVMVAYFGVVCKTLKVFKEWY